MFRKTLITVTIAAAAFLALGSPAPASANGWECAVNPFACGPGPINPPPTFDAGVVGDFVITLPGDTLTIPVLPDDVSDAIIEGPSIDIPQAGLPNFDLPEAIVPGPVDEPPAAEPAAPVDETTTTTAAPVAEEPVVGSESFSTDEAHGAPTTTVTTGEVTDAMSNIQVAEAIAAPGADQGGSFDPMMAALFGALGSLAIVLLTLSAFAAGRRRN